MIVETGKAQPEDNAAIAKMRDKKYGLVISDWNMEPMTGYELLRQVRNEDAIAEMIPTLRENKGEPFGSFKKLTMEDAAEIYRLAL